MPDTLITSEVRALIGRDLPPERNRFAISDEMAFDVADAIEDLNPLYVDPAFAQSSRFAGLLCPPLATWKDIGPPHRLLWGWAGVPLPGSAALQQLRPQRWRGLAVFASLLRGQLGHPPVQDSGCF